MEGRKENGVEDEQKIVPKKFGETRILVKVSFWKKEKKKSLRAWEGGARNIQKDQTKKSSQKKKSANPDSEKVDPQMSDSQGREKKKREDVGEGSGGKENELSSRVGVQGEKKALKGFEGGRRGKEGGRQKIKEKYRSQKKKEKHGKITRTQQRDL